MLKINADVKSMILASIGRLGYVAFCHRLAVEAALHLPINTSPPNSGLDVSGEVCDNVRNR